MEPDFLVQLAQIGNQLPWVWTFMLLATRYSVMMMFVPGIGLGSHGMFIRGAGIMTMVWASMLASPIAALPENLWMLGAGLCSEAMLGLAIGLIPTMVVAGVQTAATLSSTTMGLGAAQLIDPTLGTAVPSLARLLGDLTIILFLLMGGHYVVIYVTSGLGGTLVPGSFFVSEQSIELLMNRSADIMSVAIMISAPVIVALLLTQFVMGLITKAVPTVNIFIVSFPLTIGIGLILTGLSLPDIMVFLEREIAGIENSLIALVS
jgi:flagellar biosynthetic protein FliR